MALAFFSVLIQLWQFGSLLIIGLGLAFSFACYGLLRKKIDINAQTGMLIETLWLPPAAAVYPLLISDSPTSQLSASPWSLNMLLMATGIVTTVSLLFFTAAANQPHAPIDARFLPVPCSNVGVPAGSHFLQ